MTINILIESTQSNVEKIKLEIDAILVTLPQNPSVITKIANAWGPMPLWQKMLIGIGVTLPLLLIGIFAHVPVLTAISVFCMIAVSGYGFILNNHYKNSVESLKQVQKKIDGLVEILNTVISELDSIKVNLVHKVEDFTHTNAELENNIESLHEEMAELADNVTNLLSVRDGLEASNTQLKQSVEVIATHNERYAKQVKWIAIHNQINRASFEKVIENLDQQNTRFLEENAALIQDIEKTKAIGITLTNAVSRISPYAFGEEKEREVFVSKLREFLTNNKMSLQNFVASLKTSIDTIARVHEELPGLIEANRLGHKNLQNLLAKEKNQTTTTGNQLAQLGIMNNRAARVSKRSVSERSVSERSVSEQSHSETEPQKTTQYN